MTVIQSTQNQTVSDAAPERPRSTWRLAWYKLTRKKTNILCLAVLALYLIVGLCSFTPFFAKQATAKVAESYAPPSLASPNVWLGADIQGQSVLWRVLYGTRVALTIAVIATGIEIFLGLFFGVIAGYFGGIVDSLIIWLFTTLNTIPWILLVIAMTYALKGQSFFGHELSDLAIVILALGLTGWTGLCRLVRGEVLRIREMDYVLAARALGISTPRILFRHVIPQTFHLAIITGSLSSVGYVQAEVVLSFLGLGISRDPSWGRMIDDAKLELLRGVWWQLLAATVAIFIISLVMNFLGDALRDALDPRLTGAD
jgi:peptide/nickel transport system permease protein